MKKINVLLLFLILGMYSCKEENKEVDLAALKEKVTNNEHFISYSKNQNEILMTGVTHEVSFKNVDRQMVQANLSSVKTVEDLSALYKRAGMIGAEKLATLQFEINKNLKDLANDIPELKKVSKEQLSFLLKVEPTIKKEDVEQSAKNLTNKK